MAKKQLTALNRATELVTLTVGGNDLDVSGVARACTTGTQTDDCREAIDAAFVALEGLDDSHGIGSPVPFINATGPDAFHPNAAGYRAYADAIFDALSGDG